ncbi:MAG: hypothetical protein M1819_004375 [Sarea resinae]|nr:MAG: hypothetical protein M1819_004375 [Sarea resinae]
MSISAWALPQLARLLPIDDDSLKQIIEYTLTLPKDAAAEHLKNLLGDGPGALEFIASFNSRREDPASSVRPPATSRQPLAEPPEPSRKPRHRQKKPLNQYQAPRRANEGTSFGDVSGGYIKKDEDDYMAAKPKELSTADMLALSGTPDARQLPIPKSSASSRQPSPKLPPSSAGTLISDMHSSRSSSPASKSKTKINISGGTSMHGQSSTIDDLDSAIRALEIQTNPTLSDPKDNARRRCNCMATRHPLLAAAPNCLNCGKVICVKEGLAPCTFCGKPLLSAGEIQSMVRTLRDERGKERMEVNNASYKRAEVSKTPRAFASQSPATSAPSSDTESEKLAAAKQHRDKLLGFQAQNARRTHIIDEAADFETPTSGQSMWATPQERALQLKKQQKVLREQEWNARPEYEKRRVVVSVDLVGGKVVKRMGEVERPGETDANDDDEVGEVIAEQPSAKDSSGAFSRNPLLGSLIRPVYKGKGKENAQPEEESQRSTWRRVQDENDDNEQWILDGGVYGGDTENRILGTEEHAQG